MATPVLVWFCRRIGDNFLSTVLQEKMTCLFSQPHFGNGVMILHFLRYCLVVFSYILSCIVVGSLSSRQLQAKLLSDSTASFQTDYFTGGLSYAYDAGIGRKRVGALFSGSYTRRFSPAWSAELMVSQTDGYRNSASVSGGSSHFIKSLTISDLTVYFFPLEHLAPTFCLGAGASMFWSIEAGSSSFPPNTSIHITYFQTFSLGVNLKAQYLFPISERISLGVRGSAHFTYLPFQAEIQNPPNPFFPNLPQPEPPSPSVIPTFSMASLGAIVCFSF